MRAYIVPRGEPIDPFEVGAEDCPIGARTLAQDRALNLQRLGLETERTGPDDEVTGPCLVMASDVWATRQALKLFLKAAPQDQISRLALPPSEISKLTLPLQDLDEREGAVAFEIAFVPEGVRTTASDAFSESRWTQLPLKELAVEVPAPQYILGSSELLKFPLTSSVVMRVRHWVHVLRAGHVAPAALLLDQARRAPVSAALRAALGWRPTKPSRERALKARFVYRGRRCFVHPTAVVEASILGDDVHIGAFSYVTGSVIGDRVTIEQRAHVEQSCLGEDVFVSKNSSISACVAFADTDLCTNGIQACVVGPRCGLTSFARPLDLVPGGQVKVVDGERLREVGPLPCGVAFGPEVFVGAGVVIAPGRAIPRGVRLVAPPGETLQRPPAANAGTGYVDAGEFRKIET